MHSLWLNCTFCWGIMMLLIGSSEFASSGDINSRLELRSPGLNAVALHWFTCFIFFFTVLILYFTEARVRNNVNDIKEIKKSALSSRVFALFAGVLSQWREQLPRVIPLSAGMPPYLRQRPKQDFRCRNTPTSHKLQVAENVPRNERFASGLSMLSECTLSVSTSTHKNKQPKSFLMQLEL